MLRCRGCAGELIDGQARDRSVEARHIVGKRWDLALSSPEKTSGDGGPWKAGRFSEWRRVPAERIVTMAVHLYELPMEVGDWGSKFSKGKHQRNGEMETICMSVVKKANELEQMTEILIIGEQLRYRLHEERIIKDRRYHLKTYPNCFVAREVRNWLIDRKEAPDRETAIKLMQKLIDTSIIHHAVNETEVFKDGKGFYRFRKDDGTFPLDQEVKVFMRGQRIYEKLMNTENSLLLAREEDGVKYERTFVASQFLDWLMLQQEAKSRPEAVQLCRRLLEHAVIQHVAGKYHFVDSVLSYQFRLNFRRRRRLMELLNEKPQAVLETHDSPFCLRKQNHDKASSFHSVSPTNEVKTMSNVRRSSLSSSGSFGGYFHSFPMVTSNVHMQLSNPRSVLKRPVTLDELLTPGAPYVRKTLTIVSDAVGWGFVVRGDGPCHIQAVDPSGPAAAGGVKLRQFVVSVNGVNVLDMDFRKVSSRVLNGPRTIVMEVMEEIKS